MKLSDFVFEYLQQVGVEHAFVLTGGGIMHLVDSLGNSNIKYVCCHHEQAAAIAAQAYDMYAEKLSVCLVTTGPGGTNALTGVAAAYVDSTPVIYLSGQVKRADFASLRNVRQYGAQENDIVSMVKPVTKYAATVNKAEDILSELEKAVYYATTGRKGPVWLDIPLDVQAEEVDVESLTHFTIGEKTERCIEKELQETMVALSEAKRPLVLIGQGTVSADAYEELRGFIAKTGIPIMATWRALDFMDSEDDRFWGSPGLQAPRFSNILIQHADLLIVLGSRLDNMITAFNEEHFGYRAKKIIVDIDDNELRKLKMPQSTFVKSDVKLYLKRLNAAIENKSFDYSKWLKKGISIKRKFPILAEIQDDNSGVDLYRVTTKISEYATENDTVVISSTSRCNTAGHIAFNHKCGQKTISSMGMGSMGFALPSAVGVFFANGGKRVIVIEGDGSLQLNLQELQTIVSYGVDVKIFVFDNRGYAAITIMQERNFEGHYVGSNEQSGLFMPNTGKIAEAYGIPYWRIEKAEDIEKTVCEVMAQSGPVICEIKGSLHYDEIPKCISRIDGEGNRVSAFLENPYPFLPDKEMEVLTKFLID